MTNVYLLKCEEARGLVQKKYYRKGKKYCYFETSWSNVELIFKKSPDIKKYKPDDGMLIEEFEFKSDRLESELAIVIPKDVPEKEKTKILAEYDSYPTSFIYVDGWTEAETTFEVKGKITIQKKPFHILTLFTPEFEELVMRVDKEKFSSYLKNGVPQEDIDELEDSTEFNAPIFDESTSIDIDGEEIPNIRNQLHKIYASKVKELDEAEVVKSKKRRKIEYAVVTTRWVKRSWYILPIFEQFNVDKLEVDLSREIHFGSNSIRDTFTVSYDGNEFEFKENYGANSEDSYLRTSSGECHDYNIIESEDDEDEDEDEDE